jgi:hypothetical protein
LPLVEGDCVRELIGWYDAAQAGCLSEPEWNEERTLDDSSCDKLPEGKVPEE